MVAWMDGWLPPRLHVRGRPHTATPALPLANLPALLPALDTILSPQGLGIGARHVTLSTSGLVPKILELAKYPAQIRLAISLHGGDDETRTKIMPINERYPIAELMRACEKFIEQRKTTWRPFASSHCIE